MAALSPHLGRRPPPRRPAAPSAHASAWAAANDPEDPGHEWVGAVLDERYRLIRPLGAGGMGSVYLAEHVMLGEPLAVKVLSPRLAADFEWIQRFYLEARATLLIRHEHIVRVLDFAAPAPGQVYMVMEYIEGESLADLSEREGPIPWQRALRIADQIAAALAAAHARGIVHRDIKPSNCLRTCAAGDPDFIKVLDFGIAKFLDPARDGLAAPHTSAGLWMGTAEYMAPELFRSDPVDARVDIYALGALLYQLVTGRTPYQGTHLEVATRQLAERPPPASRAAPGVEIPGMLDDLLARLLALPDARVPTMRALRDEIAVLLAIDADTPEPTQSRQLAPTLLARLATPPAPAPAPAPRPRPPAPRRAAAATSLFAAAVAALTLLGLPSAVATDASSLSPSGSAAALLAPVDASDDAAVQLRADPVLPPLAPESVPDTPPTPPPAAPDPTGPAAERGPVRAAPLPRQLGAAAIWGELRRLGPALERRCFRPQGLGRGTPLVGSVRVGPGGAATVTFPASLDPALARCVQRQLATHLFPRSRAGGGLVFPFSAYRDR